MQSSGLRPLTTNITAPGDLARLPLPYDWIVNTASSGKGGAEEYQQTLLRGPAETCSNGSRRRRPKDTSTSAAPGVFIQTDPILRSWKPAPPNRPRQRAGYSWPQKSSCSMPSATGNSPPSSCAWPGFTAPGAVIYLPAIPPGRGGDPRPERDTFLT